MKNSDAFIQTLLISFSLVVLILGITVNRYYFIYLLLLQVTTGFWQLGSALIVLKNHRRHTHYTYKKALNYLKMACIHITIGALLTYSKYNTVMIAWIYAGWLLSIYYYVITVRSALGVMPARKTFMDIMS